MAAMDLGAAGWEAAVAASRAREAARVAKAADPVAVAEVRQVAGLAVSRDSVAGTAEVGVKVAMVGAKASERVGVAAGVGRAVAVALGEVAVTEAKAAALVVLWEVELLGQTTPGSPASTSPN